MTYEFGVQMSCSGCSNAVNRVLARRQDLKSYNVDLTLQKVTVEADGSTPTLAEIEQTIAKTGKKITYAKEF